MHALDVISGAHTVRGIGLGLRQRLAPALFEAQLPELRFLEIHPENYVLRGGRFADMLERARARWPLLTHGLTLGLGAVEPYEAGYVRELARLLDGLQAPWHSEHLCFCGADGVMSHDLLPIPFTRECIPIVVARIRELRDALQRPIAIENTSYYARLGTPEMSEIDFLLEVAERADAKLLLDVNNVFVNAKNHGFDPYAFIDAVPVERVVQIHVAGHSLRPSGLIIDTHGEAVCDEVFALLEHTLRRVGPVPVLLERDQGFPEFARLSDEIHRLHEIYVRATGEAWP